MPADTYVTLTNSIKKGFPLPGGYTGAATVAFDVSRFLDSFDQSIVLNRYSPVLQKSIGADYQNNIAITGSFRTDFTPTDDNLNCGYSFITVRKGAGTASAYSGYGFVWRPSSPTYNDEMDIAGAVESETYGAGYYDITCADPGVGIDLLYLVSEDSVTHRKTYTPFNYVEYDSGAIKGCYLPTAAPTTSHHLCHMSPNIYIVDNDPAHGDMYASKYIVDPLTGLAYIQAGTALIEPGTKYYFGIEITSTNAITVSMNDTGAPFVEGDIIISSGATSPMSEFLNSPNMDYFGISVFDTYGSQWWYDNLKISLLDGEHAVGYFRFDVSDISEDMQIELSAHGTGGTTDGIKVSIWDGAAWEDILTAATSENAVMVSNIFTKTEYAAGGYIDIRVTTTEPGSNGLPSYLEIDYIKVIRALVSGVHMGGCVDVYIDDPDAAITTITETVDASSYSIDLLGSNDIFNITSVAIAGAGLLYAKDYIIVEADPSISNSILAKSHLKFKSTYGNLPATISYWESLAVASAQAAVELDKHRPLGINVLVKHKRIHEITATPGDVTTKGYLEDYLSELPYIDGVKTISYSDLSKYIYGESGTYTALTLSIKSYDGNRMKYRTIGSMGQEYQIDETETFRIMT